MWPSVFLLENPLGGCKDNRGKKKRCPLRRESWSAILNIIIQVPGTSRRKSRQASSQALCGHLPSPIPHPSSSKNLPGAPARPRQNAPWPRALRLPRPAVRACWRPRQRPGPERLHVVSHGGPGFPATAGPSVVGVQVSQVARRRCSRALPRLAPGAGNPGPPCVALLFPRNALLRSPTQPHPSLLRCPGPGTGGERRNDQVLGLILF